LLAKPLLKKLFKTKTRFMRKIYSLLFALLLFAGVKMNAQISVTGGAGLAATYTSFTNAGGLFAAINATAQTGNNIVVSITGDITGELGTTSLNAGTWASITISPSGGAARTISGTTLTIAPLQIIDLNGADNVTINGLNSGGNSLTIANLSTQATSGTSTIRFTGGATNNTITNCNIQGSGTMAVGTNGGNIYFATDANTANGNDNNTISNNNIGPAGSNLPTKCIYGSGSTTTTAIGNSGNSITNNNIFNYFNAATTSSGLYINGGCNTWSITNNRFYQTATRTWTTGAVHNAINIQNSTSTSGAQGFTITGNIIGYASNTQTGTYTLTGSTGKFQAINFNGITLGTSSNISNNTVAAVSMTGVTSSGTSTSSPLIGIIVTNGVATTSSNTIGSQSATGSLVFSTTTTTATDVHGIYNFSVDAWTANSNNIGGISVTNAGASGTFIVYGMRANTGTGVTWTATSNNVGGTIANSIQLTGTGVLSQVVGMLSSNAPMALTSNTVRNLTTNIGTGTGTAASVIGISHTSTTPVNNISQCTIHTLTNTNATGASVVTGIQFTGSAGANIVERNLIHNLNVSTNSTAAEVNGIRVGGGTTTYRNNMIALGANISNAIGAAATNSSTAGINGINGALGTDNFYHNSVYIGGTATAGAGNSYAFNGTQTTNTRAFRDNIFFNARTNGAATGKHYAVKINGTTANPAGLTINNNVYFANGTGAVFGFFNSLDVANLTAWKTAVGQDANSFEGNPQYNDPTNATPDLHLHPTNVTVAEGNGVDVGVTLDYDGQTRSGLTPVDIGADAGNYTGADLTGPAISYTPLSSTCTLTGVTLSATITDATGVPTSGAGLPVLYWRVNAGAYTAVTGSFVSGSTYSFGPFGTGVVADVISYYIVAQDIAGTPNVSASPSGGASGFSINPPAVTIPPATPSSFTLQSSIGGAYNVGSGQTYTTITAAIAAYNTSCLTGAVVFNLTDAAYTEAAAMTINANAFASATNTLTIKPTLANTTIAVTGGSASAIFVLNGADYVTIDGSINNTANTICPASSASRDLTITNTNTGTSSAVVWLQTATADGATNNTIKNCNLVGNSNTTTLFGLGSGASTISISSLGTGNNNNSFVNNNISKTQWGIYSQGASAASKNTGNTINQNLVNTATPNNVKRAGVLVGFENNIAISGNNIDGMTSAVSAEDVFGISLGATAITTSTFTGNEVTNATITKNVIGSVRHTNTYSACGIFVAPATSGTNLIANNMISGVSANGTSGDFDAGILIGGGAGSTTNIYYNTVNMQGTQTGGSDKSYALAIGGSNPIVDVRNNILVNTQNNGSGLNYAMGLGYSTYTNLTSNNNDFYTTTGALYAIGGTGSISAPTAAVSFANFQTATGKDANSLNILPVFTSATDLHLVPASNALLNGSGTPISVTDDIDCDSRDASTPDMGADEFSSPSCTGAVGGTASGSTSFCGSGTPAITATGYSTGTTSGYQWYSSTNIGDYPNAGTAVGGQTNPVSLTTGVVSTTTYYWLRVTCGANSSTDNSTMVTVTVNPTPTASASNNSPVCSGGTINLNGTTDIGTSFSWTGPNGFTSTSEDPSIAGATTAESGVYSFTATLNGCTSTPATTTVVVNQNPSAVTVTPATATICAGASVALSASGGDISASAVQLGSGTSVTTASSTSSALGPNPLQSYYGGSKQQMIVLASELTGLGMGNGSEISSIAYNLIAAETGRTLQNLQVKMSHTATSAFASTTFLAAGTVVRTAANLSVTTGWNTIPLDANFTWNGIDNLLIEINFSNNDGGGSGTSTAQYSTTAFASTLFYRVDNNTATAVDAATTASFAAYTQRNNMRFDFTTPANFTWTPPASGLDVYTGANVNATPAASITYTATSTVNGCSSNNTAVITVNPNYDIVATTGSNGTVAPLGTTTLSCDGTGDQTYTITPDPGYLISDLVVDGTSNTPLTTGSYAAGGTFDFINVSANHTIHATFAIACVNVGITSVTASNPGPLCSGQTTNLTANGVVGTNAVVTWWTGPNGTGTNLGTGTTLNNVGANTYYARVTGDCGAPAEASVTINSTGNIFTGTGNWSDNARWSCGAPPSSGDAVTIDAGANCTLDVNFTVSGSLIMNATSTLIVNPTRTLSVDVAATANFNGQSVTFLSDATGTASLGQVNGTLSGASNVTVERYIPNNGFRSWRLLSVPTQSSRTIRQSWQEGDANPLAQQNNVPDRGTQITGVFGTAAAAIAAGFDSTSVQASMLRWNGAGWSNITSTNQAINNFNSYFLYVRGERSRTVTGATTNSSATTLRTRGTVYTGDQVTNVGASAFALVPNLYPSAISFTGLTRTGGVNNLFYIWDSKKLSGTSLGTYQTFSATNSFNCLISGGSYTLGQPNTVIESGQSFFVTSGAAGTITLKESAKIAGGTGLGFRPTPSAVKSKLDTRLYNSVGEMMDANTVVFDAVYSKAVAEEDAPKMGNPAANFAIETGSKLLAIEGTAPVKENDAIQYRMWNMAAGNYKLELAATNLTLPAGTEAVLEDSYLGTKTVINTSTATTVNFTVDANAASAAANRFRVVIAKASVLNSKGYTIAPNPVEGNNMNVVFSQQAAGRYSVRIVSAAGQVVSTYRLTHGGGSANQSITLPAVMGNGTYSVEIVAPDKSTTVKTVLVNRK
jgi:trimeric autotransporter adhesin